MMANKNSGKQLHFLLFPWLALGHINPFVELSKGLAMNGHTVSFLSTPVNISRIKRSLTTQDWPGRIDLLEMPLPPTEGLTSGAECTADVPNEMAAPLKNAMDSMEKPFRSLLGQLSPDYVVHDFSQFWTQSVAAEMGVPAVFFIVFSPATCAHSFHPAKLRNPGITVEEVAAPPRGFPSSAISFSLYEARGELPAYREVPGQLSPAFRTARCLEGCLAVAVKTSFEDEDKYIRYFQDVNSVPVLSVGPLMPVLQPVARGSKGSNLMEWLDKQREASVVFVSFGSETFLSREQVRELALGLEASGLMFLWSLRSPEADPLGLLPEGFQTRTRDMGIITGEWVPQLQIVSHPAVGGYLCHAGWSSSMEALSFGAEEARNFEAESEESDKISEGLCRGPWPWTPLWIPSNPLSHPSTSPSKLRLKVMIDLGWWSLSTSSPRNLIQWRRVLGVYGCPHRTSTEGEVGPD